MAGLVVSLAKENIFSTGRIYCMVKENIFPTVWICLPPLATVHRQHGRSVRPTPISLMFHLLRAFYSSSVCLHKKPSGSKYKTFSLLKSELEVQVMMAKNLQTPRLFSMYTYEDINCDTSLMLKMTNLIFILAPSHERFFLADSPVCFRHFCPNRRKFCSTDLDVISNTNGVRSATYCH